MYTHLQAQLMSDVLAGTLSHGEERIYPFTMYV
jgi:hypothetical protein